MEGTTDRGRASGQGRRLGWRLLNLEGGKEGNVRVGGNSTGNGKISRICEAPQYIQDDENVFFS